eukprot:9388476-Alexandrium_andersonii.AAC.1
MLIGGRLAARHSSPLRPPPSRLVRTSAPWGRPGGKGGWQRPSVAPPPPRAGLVQPAPAAVRTRA